VAGGVHAPGYGGFEGPWGEGDQELYPLLTSPCTQGEEPDTEFLRRS